MQVVRMLDQAARHVAKGVEIPDNIMLLHLTPYVPELNPTEQV